MREYTQNRPVPHSDSDWDTILRASGLEKKGCLSMDCCHTTSWQAGAGKDGFSLVTVGECSSSMDLAWRLVNDEHFPVWSSVLATNQSAGRGRSRRQWFSPPGNVYASIRLPLLDSAWRDLTHLLSAAGVMAALLDLGLAARIKWPNDILVDNKKVGGILIEERLDIIVAGVGLNVASSPPFEWMREGFSLPAACLADFGERKAPPELWLSIFHNIRSIIEETTSQRSPIEFLDYLENYMAYFGDTVVVASADGKNSPAILIGLDAGGGIKVRTAEGVQLHCSGAVYPALGK